MSSKRESVLDTAERLFYEDGFHATGIDRVVVDAGVARMTLYHHFPSKEALIGAVLARRYARYLDDLREAVTGRGNTSALTALAECHNQWLRTQARHGCIVLKAIGEFETHKPAIAEHGRALKQALLELIGEALATDGHAPDEAMAERVLIVLEGANAMVPVLGAERAIRHVHALLADVGRHQVTAHA